MSESRIRELRSELAPHGRFNLGLCNDYVLDAARRARVVIAEVSDRVPWVYGAELPPNSVRLRVGSRVVALTPGPNCGQPAHPCDH